MTIDDDESETVATFWSAGSYGAFPIEIVKRDREFYVYPMEHDERGPFGNLEDASSAAEDEFGCTEGGFWDSLEDAEEQFRKMDRPD